MWREGKKAKTLGRRYPKPFFPNVPQPLYKGIPSENVRM